MQDVKMVVGYPASGKSSASESLIAAGFIHLNRDKEGGSIADLLPKFEELLVSGKNVVLDNLFPSVASRAPFLEMAKKHKVPVECVYVSTSLEDSQINALFRMMERYKQIFWTPEDLQKLKEPDPNMFPSAVLFKYRNEFEKPSTAEGFIAVTEKKFVRRPYPKTHKHKALILDFDGTLRDVPPGTKYKYPTAANEVQILPGRTEILKRFIRDGYLIMGATNQSGVAKGHLSDEDARRFVELTMKMLDVHLTDYGICTHKIPPMTCYCRKPQSGQGVYLIHRHKLDPTQCIFVGDQTTDKTFANRLGIQYVDQAEFFKK